MSRGSYPIMQGSRGRGSLDLVFDGRTEFDPRITFTRASTGTYVNSSKLIQTALSNEPRIDYDPLTGACKGLLIEESRVNLLTYSEQFDNAAWVKTNATISPNAVASPDGTVTGDKLIDDVVNSGHYLQQLTTITTATAYTATVFIRAGERTKVDVLVYRGATFAGCSVDLSAGTKSTPQTAAVTDLSASAVVTALPSGFYRVSIPITSDGTSGGIRISLSNGSSTAYTGDGTSGIFLWGAQLEASSYPTSYIPTVASQVTRAADVASMTGTNFSSWYRQDEGSFVVECASANPLTTGFGRMWSVSDGTNSNVITLLKENGSGSFYTTVQSSGVVQFIFSTASVSANTLFKNALGYKVNDSAMSHNGSAVATDTSCTIPSVNVFRFADHGGGVEGGKHIFRLTYYPKRLTNTELQALSTQ